MALCVAILAFPANRATAATASELFADGNRLFREDLYFAALLRYRQASEAGMDTPLLHYNTGVAHYRAGQYQRARAELEAAASYGPLAPLAHYNLGLNAMAANSRAEALRWFRQARDQQARPDVSRLAVRAIERLRADIRSEPPTPVEAAIERRERRFTNLDIEISTGGGMDSNVFRSPTAAYVDLSDPAQPTVVPVVQSGFFVPVAANVRYQVNSLEHEGFFGSYRLGGRYYQDRSLSNADEYLHEVAFGSEYHNEQDDRETRIYSAFKVARHVETWFDPDTGIERSIAGDNAADRLSYLRYGPELWAQRRFGRLTLGGRARGQLWNYDTVGNVPEYDFEYWQIALHGQYRFTQTSLLRLTAEYYTRRFGDRPAFELDGTQPIGNPTIRYDYTEFGVEARQRVSQAMWFGMGYARTERTDQHVGYNDYTRDEFKASLNFRVGRRFELEAAARYRNYAYRNAFAFHEPTAGRKTLETTFASASATYRLTEHFDLFGEFRLLDVASNDTRIAYSRTLAILALRWQQ